MPTATIPHCFKGDAADPYLRFKSVMALTVLILTLLATLTQIAHNQASDPSECELILFNCPGGLGDPSRSSSPVYNEREI